MVASKTSLRVWLLRGLAVFAVIAGAMVFLALDELLPAARTYSKGHETVYGMLVGMAVIALSLVLFK